VTQWGPALPPTSTPKMRFAGLCERERTEARPAPDNEGLGASPFDSPLLRLAQGKPG
jgi:hypothetical protein